MEIPKDIQNQLDEMINSNDPDLTNVLNRYKDFLSHCDLRLSKETNPEELEEVS